MTKAVTTKPAEALQTEARAAFELAKDSEADGKKIAGSNRPFNKFRAEHPDFNIDFTGFDFEGVKLYRKETSIKCDDVSPEVMDLSGLDLRGATNLHLAEVGTIDYLKRATISPEQAAAVLGRRGVKVAATPSRLPVLGGYTERAVEGTGGRPDATVRNCIG